MFIFPRETSTAHVRLTTTKQDLRAVTVCLRSFTDLQRSYTLFSLATPSASNGFLIFKSDHNNEIGLWVRDQNQYFRGQNYKLNTWHSLCSIWDSASGLAQLWLDGKPSSLRLISSGSSISGPIIIVLGQDQDTHGGGFVIEDSFMGMLSDVHMWDYAISPCEIQNYMVDQTFTSGNVLNWRALEFQIIGPVLIEDEQKSCY
ncbi:C-reactive protein-like [Pagrus major]|uniref:C-reactive protein-like n=1 Tax=Pagrus major TaxID=143350 RepID=UPI003CC83F1B